MFLCRCTTSLAMHSTTWVKLFLILFTRFSFNCVSVLFPFFGLVFKFCSCCYSGHKKLCLFSLSFSLCLSLNYNPVYCLPLPADSQFLFPSLSRADNVSFSARNVLATFVRYIVTVWMCFICAVTKRCLCCHPSHCVIKIPLNNNAAMVFARGDN